MRWGPQALARLPESFDKAGEPLLDTPLTNKYVPSLGKSLKDGIPNLIAEFIPMEDLVDRLTAGKFGQLHDPIFGRLSDASDRKAIMAGAVRDKLKPLLDAYTMREKRDFARKEISGTPMTRENLVMLGPALRQRTGRQRLTLPTAFDTVHNCIRSGANGFRIGNKISFVDGMELSKASQSS